MLKYRFSLKFYLGIVLIIVSLLIGKITQIVFLYYFYDPPIRWTAVVIYVLSWIPFGIGIWWVGREYSQAIRKYFSYKYYHEAVKVHAGKAISKSRAFRSRVRKRMRQRV
ncbi:hypothetical protein HYT55_00940 [Candidatus Woesearchaeota archaeon]|nr:hypothetical protein [Candidatus Woesearchaeota archaeon]